MCGSKAKKPPPPPPPPPPPEPVKTDVALDENSAEKAGQRGDEVKRRKVKARLRIDPLVPAATTGAGIAIR